jgi:hypothetical protein
LGDHNRCVDKVGIDLTRVFDKESDVIANLWDNPIKLIDVVYAVCQPQCEARGMTDIQFGESFSGQCIEDSYACLMTALADFFPNRRGAILKDLTTKITRAADALTTKVEADMQEITSETLYNSALNMLESSESIREDLRSEN